MDAWIWPPLLAVHPLASVNAALNATATVLLLAGYVLIKRRREKAHRNVMLAAFGVSVAFLACYLVYHVGVMKGKSTPFNGAGPIRLAYFGMWFGGSMLIGRLLNSITAQTVPSFNHCQASPTMSEFNSYCS